MLPAASRACTWNVWKPSSSLEYHSGLVHCENARPSSLQRNATPASASVKDNFAVVSLVRLAGVEVITGAGGGVRSMTHA